MPEISVVMGVYNGAEHLRKSIDSILSQEGVDFEFIIVNDGSTDESGKILDEYARRDSRVKVLHQENTGLTKALIRGCSEAKGPYIARQDAGDVSLPGRLEKQLTCLRDNDSVVLVSCGTRFTGPRGEYLYDNVQINDVSTKRLHPIDVNNVKGPSHHGNTMFRRKEYELSGGYRHHFRVAQDWDLWTRLVEYGEYLSLSDVLYEACLMPQSISSLSRKQQLKMFELILQCSELRRKGQKEDSMLEFIMKISKEQKKKWEQFELANYYYYIASCLRSNKSAAARYYYLKAIKYNPLHIKAIVRLFETGLSGLLSR